MVSAPQPTQSFNSTIAAAATSAQRWSTPSATKPCVCAKNARCFAQGWAPSTMLLTAPLVCVSGSKAATSNAVCLAATASKVTQTVSPTTNARNSCHIPHSRNSTIPKYHLTPSKKRRPLDTLNPLPPSERSLPRS